MADHYSTQRLRRGVAHFLWGKASSALLSFVGFLVVARLLQTQAFGRYIALLAVVELALNLASFGLDWVSTRYVPEYRVHAGGARLARFVLRLCGLQLLLIAAVALVVWLVAPRLAGLIGIGGAEAALRIYAAYLLIEGASRVLRDQMLSQLLLQGRAQIALVLRHLVWVGACGLLLFGSGQAELEQVARIELTAAAVGLAVAAVGLGLALAAARREAVPTSAEPWAPPPRRELWTLAVNSYLSFLLNIPARPQVLTLLVTRLAGVDAAAIYGFARSLADQVLRFLPAELLLGFVRPALVARYVAARDFAALNRQVSLLLTVSLLVLAPLLALVAGQGGLVVRVLGGGRYEGSAPVLALLLVGAALFSHRRMLEFVANTVGCPQAISKGSGVMLGVPAVVLALLLQHSPVWTVPAAMLVGELVFGLVAMRTLMRAGVPYAAPLKPLARVASATVLASLLASLLPEPEHPGWPTLLAYAAIAFGLAAAGLALLRPLDATAVAVLKATMGSRKTGGDA